jgi:hypothetical protein
MKFFNDQRAKTKRDETEYLLLTNVDVTFTTKISENMNSLNMAYDVSNIFATLDTLVVLDDIEHLKTDRTVRIRADSVLIIYSQSF